MQCFHASLMCCLKNTDSISVSAIKLSSAVDPATTSISLETLPILTKEVWSQMKMKIWTVKRCKLSII